MSGSIKLHPTEGVNPKLCYCIVCDESTCIALPGAAMPAGNQRLLDPELACTKCQERIKEADGVYLMGTVPNDNPRKGEPPWTPTGAVVGVTWGAAQKILGLDNEYRYDMVAKGRCILAMPHDEVVALAKSAEEQGVKPTWEA